VKRKPLSKQRSPWHPIDSMQIGGYRAVVHARNVSDGQLRAIVAEEPMGWHLSISFINQKGEPSRYPTWDEIAHARDEMLPADIEFVMFLPKAGEYVAVHDSTFHLHEHPAREAKPVPQRIRDLLTDEEQEAMDRDLANMAATRRRVAGESANWVLP